MKFAKNLRELRKQQGISQEELADKLSVSRQAVSKWENESGYPELDKLMILCDLFHCTMDGLLKDDLSEHDHLGMQSYDEHYNLMSKASSFGIFMLMSALTAGAFMEPYFTEEKEGIIGIVFFIFITIGVLTFIYYGLQRENFKKRHSQQFEHLYAQKEIDKFEHKFRLAMVMGVGIMLLSFAVHLLLEYTMMEHIANGVWMFLISIAVTIFTYFGMQRSKYNETLPKSEQALQKKKVDDIVGKWCGCIMLSTIIVYLLWSFLFHAWNISWLVFPIGFLGCAIASILLEKHEK